jgi:DNA-binding response OmpR family regulator
MYVLIIDDNPDDREMLQRALHLHGHSTCWANNVRAGIDQMRREPVDAVLLDLDLGPGLSGFDLLHRRMSDPTLSRIPIVVLTGFSRERVLSLILDGVLFMTKPVDIDELMAKLRRVP